MVVMPLPPLTSGSLRASDRGTSGAAAVALLLVFQGYDLNRIAVCSKQAPAKIAFPLVVDDRFTFKIR